MGARTASRPLGEVGAAERVGGVELLVRVGEFEAAQPGERVDGDPAHHDLPVQVGAGRQPGRADSRDQIALLDDRAGALQDL